MRVTFWGVRGTFPATGQRFVRYGGDTMCIEVMCGATRLILDAGSGLRALGDRLANDLSPTTAHLLLSHAHMDHIMGLAQFAPLWRADTRVAVWSVSGSDDDPPSAGGCDMMRPSPMCFAVVGLTALAACSPGEAVASLQWRPADGD